MNYKIHTSKYVPANTFYLVNNNSGYTFTSNTNTGMYTTGTITIGNPISSGQLGTLWGVTSSIASQAEKELTSFEIKDIHTGRVYHADRGLLISVENEKHLNLSFYNLHLPLVFQSYFVNQNKEEQYIHSEMPWVTSHVLLLKLEIPIKQGKTPGGEFETHFIQITQARELIRTKSELILNELSARTVTDNFNLLQFMTTDKILRDGLEKEVK